MRRNERSSLKSSSDRKACLYWLFLVLRCEGESGWDVLGRVINIKSAVWSGASSASRCVCPHPGDLSCWEDLRFQCFWWKRALWPFATNASEEGAWDWGDNEWCVQCCQKYWSFLPWFIPSGHNWTQGDVMHLITSTAEWTPDSVMCQCASVSRFLRATKRLLFLQCSCNIFQASARKSNEQCVLEDASSQEQRWTLQTAVWAAPRMRRSCLAAGWSGNPAV